MNSATLDEVPPSSRQVRLGELVRRWRVGSVPTSSRCSIRGLRLHRLGEMFLALSLSGVAMAQSSSIVLERNGGVISLEPYAPNILRVTMSTDRSAATG